MREQMIQCSKDGHNHRKMKQGKKGLGKGYCFEWDSQDWPKGGQAVGTGFGFIVLTFVEIFVLSGDIVAVGRLFYFGF